MSVLATVRVDPAKIPNMDVLREACRLAGFHFAPIPLGGPVTAASIYKKGGYIRLEASYREGKLQVTYDTDYEKIQLKALQQLATWSQYVQDKQRVIDQGFTILQDTVDEWGNPVLTVEVVQEGGF